MKFPRKVKEDSSPGRRTFSCVRYQGWLTYSTLRDRSIVGKKNRPSICMEGLFVHTGAINASQLLPVLLVLPVPSLSLSRTARTLQAAQASAPPASDILRLQMPEQLQEPL